MAPKKFTYTPGTGGGKRTKEFAKKGAASKSKTPAWTPPKSPTITTRKENADVVLGGRFRGAKPKANAKSNEDILSSVTRIGGQAADFVFPEKTAGKIVKRQPFNAEDYVALAAALPLPGAKGLKAVGKGLEVAAGAAKPAKAAGKTRSAVAAEAAKAAARRTKSETATIAAGTRKGRTAEGAAALDKQQAKEQARTAVTEGPKSDVEIVKPTEGKAPVSATAAKKFGSGQTPTSKVSARRTQAEFALAAEKAADRAKRLPSQKAMAERDLPETMKFVLAQRDKAARAGADIPGPGGGRIIGGQAADAATAAPAKAKPAPKPGPKQALREKARLTAEPTGKPKKPSARASQAVKDKYATDLAAYEKQQATFERQQAAIAKKTTDIEMGKAKGPSAKETGSPMVKTGPAKAVKKPTATKPKTTSTAKPKAVKGEIVPSTKGPQAPSTPGKDLVRVPRKARVTGSARFPAEGNGPIPIRTSSVGKEAVRVPRSTELATSTLRRLPKKGNGSIFNKKQKAALALTGAAGVGTALYNKNEQKKQDKVDAAAAATPPTTDTQAKKDARHPSPDVWLDKYGRRISEAEFNRRKTWWAKAKKMDKAEFDKAYNAEVARRRKYTSGAGTKKFGAAATTVTMNKEVPKGVAPRIWNSMSESEKTRFQFKYKKNTRKAVFDLLKGKQTPNR